MKFPKDMTHSVFDYYSDFSEPLREFLLQNKINFYSKYANGPELPSHLYKNPVEMYNGKNAKWGMDIEW